MELIKSNKFEISDMPGMNTLAFLVERELSSSGTQFYSLQRIEHTDVNKEGKSLKAFVVEREKNEAQDIVLITITKNKAILNTGLLDDNGLTACESNVALSYGNVYNQEGVEYKEFAYSPDAKRKFTIIDTETCEEVMPVVYMDPNTSEIKGRCKLLPLRPYVILEVVNAVVTRVNEKGEIEYGESTKEHPLEFASKEAATENIDGREPDGLIV